MTITKEGALASFYTVNKAPIKHLRVYFSPKQAGSGDPSPTNVRPIIGWTGLEVTRCGKNLFNSDIENGGFNSSTGEEIANEKRLRSGFVFLKAGTYTISSSTSYMMVIVYIYDINKNYISSELINVFNYMPYTFTINNDRYIRLIWRRSDNTKIINDSIDNLQIELETTSSDYEPYSNTTIPIDWSSEAGTLYGGYVDLITGELVTTHFLWERAVADMNNSENYPGWKNCSDFNKIINYDIDTAGGIINNLIGNIGNELRYNTHGSGPTYPTVWLPRNIFGSEMTQTKWMTDYLDLIIQFVLPLATPITHQLTTTQLSTLIGHNNIWSDADRVEVEYDLAESNDELYRRRNILLRSVPHIETASGNIAHFETDIAAPIKSAKISFSPAQEGSGIPSPTNIRPISGLTNLLLYHSGENLYVPNSNNKGYISKSGVITVDETSTYTDLIPVNLGDVYSFECTTVSVNGDTNRRIHGYNSSGTWIQQLASGTTPANTVEYRKISATIPAGISYIRVSFRNQDTNVRIVKENIITTDWQTVAGTIYGGSINLITGELIAEYINLPIKNIRYSQIKESSGWLQFYLVLEYTTGIYQVDITSDRFSSSAPTGTTGRMSWYDNRVFANAPIEQFSTYDDAGVEAWFNEYKTQFMLHLRTPQVYHLSPQTLHSLRGTNNIWSNANGPVEIKYWTH